MGSLAATLWNLYGNEISQGEYSKNGTWHDFTPDELKRIRDVLGEFNPEQLHSIRLRHCPVVASQWAESQLCGVRPTDLLTLAHCSSLPEPAQRDSCLSLARRTRP